MEISGKIFRQTQQASPWICTSTPLPRKTTIIQPPTLLRAPGGEPVTQVPQTVERHTLEVGSATTQTQKSIRFGGSTTRSRKTNTLGPLRIASPSVALQLWKCWVHSFSRCTYVRRVRPLGDQYFCPWLVITRAISMACWMITPERCLPLACSWKSCSNSRLQVAVWCHHMWRETSTNGQMISLTLLLKGLTLRWNLWLHHYFRSSRSSLGYYNILMHKVIFLDRSQSSLPLLLRSWRRGGNASTGFGWSYSPRTLSWERYSSLILTLWPRTLLVSFDTCQQARVAQTGTQTQKEKVLLLLLLGCCLSVVP